MTVTLLNGDCLEVLAGMAPGSIDACVTDPPYHLASIVKRFGAEGAAPAKGNDAYERASRGFMGKVWDGGDIAFRPETWAAVLRVLKPGAHLVAFGAPKNYHRLACAIEDAGFEIRDSLMWLFGTGFPKSHDVAKGIDRVGGTSPKEQSYALREARNAAGLSRADVAAAVGCTEASVRDWEEGRARAVGRSVEWIVPSEEYRARLAVLLGYSEDQREIVGEADDRRSDGTVIGLGHSGDLRRGGISLEAAKWQGWGTALKPAFEPIILARKPLIGTVAANVLAHGTGALNIDATRVHADDAQGGAYMVRRLKPGATLDKTGGNWRPEEGGVEYRSEMKPGRWPANIVHDGSDEVVAAFPQTKSGLFKAEHADRGKDAGDTYGDSGSAARFFYCAKASAKDRAGSKHPTVKPIALMRWLCRLITPPGGLILDPFAGTGTTGQAAQEEGFNAVLIEREAEYQADIRRRLHLLPSLEEMLA